MSNKELKNITDRYSRQLILPNFGIKAQQALHCAKVLVVGCGGLGSPVIQYLAAAGIGQMTLYDPDKIELSNLHRQTLHRQEDIGRSKALRGAEFIHSINPDIIVEAKEEWITIHNIRNIIAKHQLVIDCTDGLSNKFLLNDACVMEERPLVHGSVTMMEGRLLTIIPGSACLRCLFESILPEGSIPICQEVGVLGPVCGVIGSLMAIEAIKLLSGAWEASTNNYIVASFDHVPMINAFRVDKNEDCPACKSEKTTTLMECNYIQPSCEI